MSMTLANLPFITSVIDTGDKVDANVKDTNEKLVASVNDTGHKTLDSNISTIFINNSKWL